jgi:tetratricopeptide (TPR) repeat protein
LLKSLNFGAGVFLFAMSIIPSKFMKLVSLAGFKANREVGLEYIKETHRSNGIRAPFATMTLLFNNLLLPRGLADAEVFLKEAEQLINESLKRYPTGSLFQVMGSHCARKQCKIDEGIKFMEAALTNSKHLGKSPLIYCYELGNCYCMKLDWKKAIEIWTPLCDEEKFQVKVICSLQVASCYIMLDEDAKAQQFLNKAINMPGKKMNFDQIVIRQAKRYLGNGGHFSAFETLYLRRDLAKMIPIMDQVLAALEKKAEKIGANQKKELPANAPTAGSKLADKIGNMFGRKKEVTDFSFDYRACYLLLKGSLLKAMKRNDEAIKCFVEIRELADFLTEKFYHPYCLYELGESYYIEGKLEEAEKCMKECNKLNGYDWEDPLRVRLRVSMDQLKKKNLPPPKNLDLSQLDFGTVEDKEEDEADNETF